MSLRGGAEVHIRTFSRIAVWFLMVSTVSIMAIGCGVAASTTATTPVPATTASKHLGHTKQSIHRLHGTVSAITATRLTLKTLHSLSVTIHLTAKTKYRANKTSTSRAQIKPGNSVTVVVHRKSGDLTARIVRVRTPRGLKKK